MSNQPSLSFPIFAPIHDARRDLAGCGILPGYLLVGSILYARPDWNNRARSVTTCNERDAKNRKKKNLILFTEARRGKRLVRSEPDLL